jgi:hypothetical protein
VVDLRDTDDGDGVTVCAGMVPVNDPTGRA